MTKTIFLQNAETTIDMLLVCDNRIEFRSILERALAPLEDVELDYLMRKYKISVVGDKSWKNCIIAIIQYVLL